ncbi:MAG: triose-phosphate isomerase [Actinomycetota bacterium]
MPDRRSRPWLGTGWKMTKTRAQAIEYAKIVAGEAPGFADEINTFVLPAYPLIEPVARILSPAGVQVGAQNVHWADEGAFTGEVSAPMLTEIGATLVSIGHAERRAMFGETNETVRERAVGALRSGLTPLICVGEPAEQRDAGTAVAFVRRQIEIAVTGLGSEDLASIMIAYEPVWAIGEGSQAASPPQASEMHDAIRLMLMDIDPVSGAGIPILYGGSVDEQSASKLLSQAEIDGLFVGRAAWSADGFLRLARIAAGE